MVGTGKRETRFTVLLKDLRNLRKTMLTGALLGATVTVGYAYMAFQSAGQGRIFLTLVWSATAAFTLLGPPVILFAALRKIFPPIRRK